MAKSKNSIKLWGNMTRRTIVMDSKGNIKPAILNEIKWHTQLPIAFIRNAVKDVYYDKQTSKAKGVGKSVRVVEVLNSLYTGQLDNFFFNMGIPVDSFLQQVNAQLPDDSQINRQYIEDTTNWTEQSKNSYNKYVGDLILPNGKQVRFNWDYDFGSSWSII